MADPAADAERDRPSTDAESGWSVFGDEVGLAIFLGTIVLGGLTWQLGFFITDSYAVANGLINVGRGHLSIERFHYSLTLLSQPGLHVVDGTVYARNYGQIFLALPAYYVLDLSTTVVDLGSVLFAGWCLAVGGLARQTGAVLGRRRRYQLLGSAAAVALFVGGAPLVSPVGEKMAALAALQLLSIGAVAILGVALYRLVARFDGQTVGAAAGCAAVVAAPTWFWSAIPKRHALTTAAVAVLLFWFAASRRSGTRVAVPVVDRSVSKSLVLRGLGYVLVGFVTWVHAFEGLVLLGAFALVDLPTAPSHSRRAVLAVCLALAVGFAPFLATNVLVSGDAGQPPRLTDGYRPGDDSVEVGPSGDVISTGDTRDGTSASNGGGGSDGAGGGSDGGGTNGAGNPGDGGHPGDTDTGPGVVERTGSAVVDVVGRTIRTSGADRFVSMTVAAGADAPSKLSHTYLRSGDLPGQTENRGEAVDLALLESMPLFGGLFAAIFGAVPVGIRRIGRRGETDRGRGGRFASLRRVVTRVRTGDPRKQTAGLALLVVAGYATLYFSFLPLHSQITVRYLLPVVPALGWLLVATTPVATVVEEATATLVGSYLGFVLVGSALVVLGFPALGLAVGEAMQLHALVNLAACATVGLALSLAVHDEGARRRVAAVALGLVGATTTVLVGFMQFAYFEYGTYVVPFARLISTWVDVLA